jgi:hypothetical protein
VVEPEPKPESGAELAATRATARKIALAVVAVLAVAVIVFWFGWVRAPSPEQICRHKIELVVATVGEEQTEGAEALVGQLEAKCVSAAQRKIKLRGKLVYAKYAKCVMAAQTLMEAERC